MALPRDRGTHDLLRYYRRINYDASHSSSAVSNSEATEKHEENQTGARERTRTWAISVSDSES